MIRAAAVLPICALLALAALPAPAFAKPGVTLSRIAQRGEIRLGYRIDAPPFSFQDEKKEPQGYSIDLCNAIAARVAVTLKRPDLHRVFVPIAADKRLEAIEKGRIDIECGITTVTLARRAQVDFTNFVFITGGGLMLRKGKSVEEIGDLKHRRIAVVRGTTIEGALMEALAQAKIEADFLSVASIDEGLEALKSKKVDALAEDRMVLLALVEAKGLKGEVSLPPFLYSYEPYAFAVRRNDADFRLVADSALADLFRSGAIWDAYERWIGALGAGRNAAMSQVFTLQAVPK